MKTMSILIGLFCAAIFISGCGNEMTVVKARQKMPKEYQATTEARWKTSYQQGLKSFNKKDYVKALEYFAVALKYTKEDDYDTRAWLYYSMGICFERQSDLPKAQQNYIMAQNLDPNLSEASDGLRRITKRLAENN
jgi:tetratricopeptide (TPR) repeat protein